MTTAHNNGKPDYDASLGAYQRAFQAELADIVGQLSLTNRARVLDVPCGNGFYARLLADRLGADGRMDCVDLCRAYLASTRRRLRGRHCQWETHEGDAYRLPFPDETFDLVWCAQSLISLKDRRAVLVEMKRVLRPGSTLAILENDVFHQVLLPWPADLEAPVQRAIQRNTRAKFGSSSGLTPVRRLPHLLEEAGYKIWRKRTFAADRQTPWPRPVRRFLEYHVKDLRKLIGKKLSPQSRAAYRRFADTGRADSVFGDQAMDLTCLNVLYEAKKPG